MDTFEFSVHANLLIEEAAGEKGSLLLGWPSVLPPGQPDPGSANLHCNDLPARALPPHAPSGQKCTTLEGFQAGETSREHADPGQRGKVPWLQFKPVSLMSLHWNWLILRLNYFEPE